METRSVNRDVFTIICLATSVKLLLLWTHFSTNFETHRNWLAITHSLPLKQWYNEETSPWTLDHPPLFAYFVWCLSQVAAWVDPKMLEVENLDYASKESIMLQRCTVMLSDMVLFYAAYIWHGIYYDRTQELPRFLQPMVLVGIILSSGLFMVDHIRFQYNGLLIGIMLLAMARGYQGQLLWSTFWFSVLLNMKLIYFYIAPAFFIYALKKHVLTPDPLSSRIRAYRLAQLSLIVLAVFSVSFGPFIYHGQLSQVMSRLVSGRRELLDSTRAPNVWAAFAFAEEVLCAVGTLLGWTVRPRSRTADPLPDLILTAILMVPSLKDLYRKPTQNGFLHSVIYCAWVSFLVGTQVQKEAILIPLLGLLPLAMRQQLLTGLFLAFSATAHVSLFQLLPNEQERLMKIALTLLYAWYMHHAIIADRGESALQVQSAVMMSALVPFCLCSEFIGKFWPSYGSLALKATTAYCALGSLQSFLPFAFTRLLPGAEPRDY